MRPVILLVLVAACSSAPRSPLTPRADRVARVVQGLRLAVRPRGPTTITFTLAERMRHYGVPGVAIAVVDSGRVVWARGFGVKQAGTTDSVTAATLFQAASISKPVASLGTMRLIQDGKLALDDDVNTRLTSWKVPDNTFTATQKVTLRRLMSHSAGLTVHGFPGYAEGVTVPSTPDILDGKKPANTSAVRVDVLPGSIFRYSGGGMTVMQLLVGDVTKRPYAEFLTQTVLAPLGMTRSTYEQPLPASRATEVAIGHKADGTPVKGKWHTYPEMAAAGLWTTPEDLARMIVGVQEIAAGKRRQPLAQASIKSMLTVTKLPYGLGYSLDSNGGSMRFSHGGANEGYRAFFVGFVETGQGAAIMTNSDNGSQLATEILAAIAAEYGWKGAYGREVDVVRLSPEQRAALVGEYKLAMAPISVRLTVAGDTVFGEAAGAMRRTVLYPTSDSTFAPSDGGPPMKVIRDAKGVVTALELGNMRANRVP